MDTNKVFDNLMSFSYKDSKEKKRLEEEKKLKPSERLLLNIEKQGFNMDQLKSVLVTKGNQLIISCAGSGKTTALVFKIIYNIVTGEATRVVQINGNALRVPDKIWVSTFLKSGADELENKLSTWMLRLKVGGSSKAINFSTLHAEFKRALNDMGVETNIIDGSENSKYLKKVLEPYSLKNGDGRPLNSENIKDLESALTYTRNRLDGKRYDRDIYEELGIGRVIIESILRDWKTLRKENGFVDFEDLQEMLFIQAVVNKDEKVINFLRGRYNYLYIDEFQDTSQIQYEILKLYISGAKKVVAIGDDDQTIYSWRGSYNGIITKQFSEDFNPTISELSLNYRCPENILNAVIPSIEKNEDRYKKSLKSSRKGGDMRVGSFSNYKIMVETLGDLIAKDIEEGMSVAILCRVNSDGLMPALILDSMNRFTFTISGDGMTLDSYIGRMVLGIIRLFTDVYSQKVEQALNMLTWDKFSVSKLMKVCKNNKISFWDISDTDLAYSCPDIYRILSVWRKARKNSGDIAALKLVLDYYRTEVFKKDTQFNRVCKSVIISMDALLSYNNYENVESFLEDVESINERLKARKKAYYGNKVRIATVHEFKGKEADSIYVWNDSKDVYPHAKSASDEEYEEERRVHYIACTRARKRSTIMYLTGKPGDFVLEMDLTGAKDVSGAESITGSLVSAKSDIDRNLDLLSKVSVKKPEEKTSLKGALRVEKKTDKDMFEILPEDKGFLDFGKLSKKKEDKKEKELQFSPEDEEVDRDDKEYIISRYKEGLDAYQIMAEFEESGYDMYSLGTIEDVINTYERYHRK